VPVHRPGNRAFDEQKIAIRIDAHDLERHDRGADVTEMTGHLLAWKYAPGRLALTDRAWRAM
jgi:hypothetical protein